MGIRHTVSIRCSIMLVLLFISFGCSHHTQVQNIDLSSAYIADAAITVDDSPKESAWQRAATMTFEETGKAMFIWDAKTLCGYVSKSDKNKWQFDPDERICVAIRVDEKTVKLCFKSVDRATAYPDMILEKATITGWSEGGSTTRLLDEGAVKAVGEFNPAKQGTAFSFEFALLWRAVTSSPPDQCRVAIEVYRIAPQRPEPRHFVGMVPAGDASEHHR